MKTFLSDDTCMTDYLLLMFPGMFLIMLGNCLLPLCMYNYKGTLLGFMYGLYFSLVGLIVISEKYAVYVVLACVFFLEIWQFLV